MAVLLAVAALAQGLEPVWEYDTEVVSRSLPLVGDYDGDGSPDIVVTTRFNGSVWVIGADGQLKTRFQRRNWLEGGIAAAAVPGQTTPALLFQESTGTVNLRHGERDASHRTPLKGSPLIGTIPCFADLDGDGTVEVLTARRDGSLTALDTSLKALWRYDSDSPFDSSPAAAPVFEGGWTVYVQSVDGVLHCLAGDGRSGFQTTFSQAGYHVVCGVPCAIARLRKR